MPARREYRSGSLWLRGNRFYLRYRVAGKQKAVFLVVKDDEFHSPTCSAVRKKAKAKLEELSVVHEVNGSLTVASFWKQVYQPHVKQNWASSTLHSYEDLYERFIEPRFGKMDLSSVKTHQLTEFLTGLSIRLNTNSIKHPLSSERHLFPCLLYREDPCEPSS